MIKKLEGGWKSSKDTHIGRVSSYFLLVCFIIRIAYFVHSIVRVTKVNVDISGTKKLTRASSQLVFFSLALPFMGY